MRTSTLPQKHAAVCSPPHPSFGRGAPTIFCSPQQECCGASGTGSFLRTLLRDLAIDFGPPVVESVNLVLSRDSDNALVARSCRLNLGNNHFFPVSSGLRERPAGHVHDAAD